MTIKTLLKASLSSSSSGKRVTDLSYEIGNNYSATYQALVKMSEEGTVRKIGRGVFSLTSTPTFSTAECISLLQSLEEQEENVRFAQEELDRAEAQLKTTKQTIRQTMLTAFED